MTTSPRHPRVNLKADIAAVLNRLPFVRWDRCVRPGDWLVAYGWIDRDDGRSDFVTVNFHKGDYCGATTSSAEWSPAINLLLNGPDVEHVECERIADVLPDVARTVHSRPSDDDAELPAPAATDRSTR